MQSSDDRLIFSFGWVAPVVAASGNGFLGLPLHVRSSSIFKMTHNDLTYQWRMSIRSRLDTKQSWLTLHYVDGPAEAVACRFEVQVSDQATGQRSAIFYDRFDHQGACNICGDLLRGFGSFEKGIVIELKLWLPIRAFCSRSLLSSGPRSSSGSSAEMTIGGALSKLPVALFDFEFVAGDGSVRCPRFLLYAFSPSMKRKFDEPLETSKPNKIQLPSSGRDATTVETRPLADDKTKTAAYLNLMQATEKAAAALRSALAGRRSLGMVPKTLENALIKAQAEHPGPLQAVEASSLRCKLVEPIYTPTDSSSSDEDEIPNEIVRMETRPRLTLQVVESRRDQLLSKKSLTMTDTYGPIVAAHPRKLISESSEDEPPLRLAGGREKPSPGLAVRSVHWAVDLVDERIIAAQARNLALECSRMRISCSKRIMKEIVSYLFTGTFDLPENASLDDYCEAMDTIMLLEMKPLKASIERIIIERSKRSLTASIEKCMALMTIAFRYDLRVLKSCCFNWLAKDLSGDFLEKFVKAGQGRNEGSRIKFDYWRGMATEMECAIKHEALIKQVHRYSTEMEDCKWELAVE